MLSFNCLTGFGLISLFASTAIAQATLPLENCILDTYAISDGWGSVNGGVPFCAARWKEGILVKSIEVQADNHILRGMIVTYSDNSYSVHGKMDFPDVDQTKKAKLEFDPTADTITMLQMWDNGGNGNDNHGVGRLIMETSAGGRLDLAREGGDDATPRYIDVKSGMLLGVAGRTGESIDRLDFIFAGSKVAKREISNMTLTPSMEEINLGQTNTDRGFTVQYLDEIHHYNELESPTEVQLRGEKKLTTSTSITKTTSDTFHLGMGFEFTIGLGIPLIGGGSITTRTDMFWEHSNSRANTDATSQEITKSWQQTATAQPGEAIRCVAWTFSASTIDVKWGGIVTITFEDGTIMQYPSGGGYQTAQYSRVNTNCEREDPEDARRFHAGNNTSTNTIRQIGLRSQGKASRRAELMGH